MEETKKHGGARKGAGRPKTGRTTKTRRIPLNLPETEILEDIIEILKLTKEEAIASKGPRWDKIKKLIQNIEEAGLKL